MECCQYLHRLDSNFRHYLIHLSFLLYWIQLLYASFSSVSSCFALHWILHCIQDISHFRGLVGAFCAGGGWEKIWVFVDMHQQSTSKGLVFHQFYAFFFCDLSPLSRLLWIIWRDTSKLFRRGNRSNALPDSSLWRCAPIYKQQKRKRFTCQDAASEHSSP